MFVFVFELCISNACVHACLTFYSKNVLEQEGKVHLKDKSTPDHNVSVVVISTYRCVTVDL